MNIYCGKNKFPQKQQQCLWSLFMKIILSGARDSVVNSIAICFRYNGRLTGL